MSPPPLPLDHLIISNQDPGGRGLLLGLALRGPPLSSPHKPSLTLSLLFPAKKLGDQSSTGDDEVSSFSNNVSVKREREDGAANNFNNDVYEDVSNNNISFGGSGRKKKLRLNKEQSALLEDSFKLQTTLHPNQKEALARQLNLRPRQVEVWFQNRRARTKLKQTEVDCEFLKKCCERLTQENERLLMELRELKQVSQQQPAFYMQLPPARLSMCPSCKTLTDLRRDPATASKNISHPNFLMSSEKPMIFSPFVTKPSAAC